LNSAHEPNEIAAWKPDLTPGPGLEILCFVLPNLAIANHRDQLAAVGSAGTSREAAGYPNIEYEVSAFFSCL
jgi:hypothetical protein